MKTSGAGGYVTIDALRWLRDTGVAFSQLDWDGAVIKLPARGAPIDPLFAARKRSFAAASYRKRQWRSLAKSCGST
jgi:hypothetical protein